MKYIIWLIVLAGSLTACNNNHKEHSGGKETTKSKADSLMEDVMDGHDVGMAKYGKLRSQLKQVRQVLDSIYKLPGAAQAKITGLKEDLQNTADDLERAIQGMDKWMEEFNMDSAVNNMEQRISYLLNEKLKIGKVKESILKSLQQADSVLQKMNK